MSSIKKIKATEVKEIFISALEASHLLGTSRQTIDAWGLPEYKEKSFRYYILYDVIRARISKLSTQLKEQNANTSDAKSRLALSQARKNEIEIAKLEGQLLEFDIVAGVLDNAAAIHKSNLYTNARKVSKKLIDKTDEREIEEIIVNEVVNAALTALVEIDRSTFIEQVLEQVDVIEDNSSGESDKPSPQKSSSKKHTKRE